MKKFLFALLSGSLILLSTDSANAYTLLGTKYSSGSFTFKDDSLQSNAYISTSRAALMSWSSSYSKLTYSYTSGSPIISIAGAYFGDTGWNAQTISHKPWYSSYYDYSQVDANYSYMDNMTNWLKQGTFGHEYGHVLGLDHVTNTNQIMCTAADGRAVNVPGTDDIAGAKSLY